MEFAVQKTDLLRELALTQRIVEKRNTIPILANILLEAAQDGVSLIATDLEVGVRTRCAATVQGDGAVTVSAKKLFEVVRMLPEEEIRVRSTDSGAGLAISCGRSEFRLVGLDAKDFPNLPVCDFRGAWECPGGLFQRMLGKVLFAVTSDESRFPISGVLFLASRKHVQLVATDGHRLAIAEVDKGLKGLSGETRLVMPKKALVEVRQMADLGDGTIACEVKDNHIYFRVGERLLVARMVEDQFPAYEKVIPKANENLAVAEKAALEGAVRRAALLSNEKARAIRLHFRPDTLTISASSPEMGESQEDLPLDYRGDEFEIAFNAQYLVDFLGVVDGDKVRLDLKDGSTQAVLRPAAAAGEDGASGPAEVNHYYVLMPMRL